MLKVILVGIIRGFRKSKLDFLLNMIGLSVAMIVFTGISIYVKNEVSFDKYHKDANRVFRLTTSLTSPNGQQTNMALANTNFAYQLNSNFPEIEEIVCVGVGDNINIRYLDNEFEDINTRKATPTIFDVFTYPVIEGNVSEFLKSPNTIVLTESLSKKIFRGTPPLGQVITIDKNNYTVNGIIEDLPTNTDLQFSALMYSEVNGTEELVDWGEYYVYCKLNSNVPGNLTEKINQLTEEKYSELLKQMGGFVLSHNLQPLASIHFDNSLLADTPKGNKKMVYLFSAVAFLILVIAAINYVNLNIAQLQRRQRELSIRKIIGCGRRWIIIHVFSESVVNFILAGLIAILFSFLLLPVFNNLFSKQFNTVSIIHQLVLLIPVFLITGLLSGIYPAYKIGKTNITRQTAFSSFGKFLVTFQNSITIIMIAAVFLVGKQVHYMKDHDLGLGMDKSQIVAINLAFEPQNFPGTETIRQEFSGLAEIESLAFGGGGTNLGNTNQWMKAIMVMEDEQGNDVQFVANQPRIDENYMDLFGIRLTEGRKFDVTREFDRKWGVIINQTYAKTMGWNEPLGKSVFDDTDHQVIGVVEDFHFDALYNPIEPLAFQMIEDQPAFLFASVEPKNLAVIKNHWEKTFKDVPFPNGLWKLIGDNQRVDHLHAIPDQKDTLLKGSRKHDLRVEGPGLKIWVRDFVN